MRRALIPLLLALLAATSAAQAQDGPTYRLREPSAAAYLELIVSLDDFDRYDDVALYDTFQREISQFDDLDDISFDLLYRIYRLLEPSNGQLRYSPIDQWPEWLIFAWLRDNNIQLHESETFIFEDFEVTVTPVDFNADGQDEWILKIHSDYFDALWVVAEDVSQANGYRRIATPLPSFSVTCFFREPCGGGAETLGIQDVNADGLPEWYVSIGSCGWGICGIRLSVLGWRDGEMVDLAESPGLDTPFRYIPAGGGGTQVVPPPGTWTFENVDDDPAQELIQSWTLDDSMGCRFTATRVFNWQAEADRYISQEESNDYADSLGCRLRIAHTALKDGDFNQAVEVYEQAQSMMPADTDAEVQQYMKLRLASGYAITGQEAAATELLQDLVGQPPSTTIMATMINAAYEAYNENQNAVAFCAALYQTISEYEYTFDFESHLIDFAQINDYAISMNYFGGDFSPDYSGCNLTALLFMHATEFENRDRMPEDQLAELGWEVTHTFQADLNDDGLDDWLIWTAQLQNYALFLLSGNNEPLVVYLPVPTQERAFTTYPSPTGTGQLLVVLTETNSDDCPNPEQALRMNLYLPRAERATFFLSPGFTLCERLPLDEVFESPLSFRAWDQPSARFCADDKRLPVEYVWNGVEGEYVGPDYVPCPVEGIPADADLFFCVMEDVFCGWFMGGQEALDLFDAMTDEMLPQYAEEDFWTILQYRRALILESLNRPDDALAEYVALYEAAPESAWGQLAALHLEVVEE